MTPDEFAALLRNRRTKLVIRCKGARGCRDVAAAVLDDRTIVTNPKPCGHDVVILEAVNGEWRWRQQVADAWTNAGPRGRKAAELFLQPRRRGERRDRDQLREEQWADFYASREADEATPQESDD